ncbi:MAG: universal stress protein [Desulfovermiculus sp.]
MAQIKKILCSVDFAEFSPQVADYARTLAEAFGAEIHVVYVAPTLAQYVGFQIAPSSIENFVSEIISGAEQTMDSFLTENFAPDQAQGHVLSGYAAEEILSFAQEHNVDLIVMGTHGRRGIDRVLFGSVAEKVVKTAPMPVVTLRPGSLHSADQ